MPPDHYKVVYDILNCRTAYLGGHVEMCDRCGTERHLYNSCRNRHCPKCQTLTKQRWLSARQAEEIYHLLALAPHGERFVVPTRDGLSADPHTGQGCCGIPDCG